VQVEAQPLGGQQPCDADDDGYHGSDTLPILLIFGGRCEGEFVLLVPQ
jgi:hypothetical protein